MRLVIKTLLRLLLCATIAHSCSFPDLVLTSTTDHQNWNKQNPALFTFVSTKPPHDIKIIVRHTDRFAYQTLPLVVTTTLNDKTYFTDTIAITLCNALGKWNGQKQGNTFNVIAPYRANVTFPHSYKQSDTITIAIAPANPPLANIHLVGIQITNAKPLFKP